MKEEIWISLTVIYPLIRIAEYTLKTCTKFDIYVFISVLIWTEIIQQYKY